jgi:hypothetical protein
METMVQYAKRILFDHITGETYEGVVSIPTDPNDTRCKLVTNDKKKVLLFEEEELGKTLEEIL